MDGTTNEHFTAKILTEKSKLTWCYFTFKDFMISTIISCLSTTNYLIHLPSREVISDPRYADSQGEISII